MFSFVGRDITSAVATNLLNNKQSVTYETVNRVGGASCSIFTADSFLDYSATLFQL